MTCSERLRSAPRSPVTVADADAATMALVEDWTLLGGLSRAGFARNEDGASLLVSGVPVSFLNLVLPWRPDAAPQLVLELLEDATARGIPHTLSLRPGSGRLEELARRRRLEPGAPVPLMVAESAPPEPPGVEIAVRRLDPAEVDVHCRIAAAGFEAPVELFRALISSETLGSPAVRAYVGYAAGEPVTTALAIVRGDHAGVYNVGTPPAARGRGYGAAVTARAARDGFRDGARFAYLQASDMGRSVYERLGFTTVEHWTNWSLP